MTFQLPIGHLGNGFSLHQWDPNLGVWTSSPLTDVAPANLLDDGNGNLSLGPDSFLSATGTIHLFGETNQPTNYYLNDDSMMLTTPLNFAGTPSYYRTSFLSTPWFSDGAVSSSFFVMLPENRFGHTFSLITDGVSYPLTTGSVATYLTGDPVYPTASYGFFEGWSSTAPVHTATSFMMRARLRSAPRTVQLGMIFRPRIGITSAAGPKV